MELSGLFGWGFNQAVWIALGIFVFLGLLIVSQWKVLTLDARRLAGTAVLVVLLVSPYLQNYDYVLLLVPLFILAGDARGPDWCWLALVYILPFLGFGIFGIPGQVSLVFSALITFMLFMNAMPKLDVSGTAAYNPTTMK